MNNNTITDNNASGNRINGNSHTHPFNSKATNSFGLPYTLSNTTIPVHCRPF
jgi:hypothetical protein